MTLSEYFYVIMESSRKRFASTSEHERMQDFEKTTPKNTMNKSKWAMKIFQDWLNEWRVRYDDDILKILKDIKEFTVNDLNYCLKYFFCDMRKNNGERYPPQTQKDICSGIQYHFNHNAGWNISIFNDKEFAESRKTLDSQMKIAAQLGLVQPKKKAIVIRQQSDRTSFILHHSS